MAIARTKYTKGLILRHLRGLFAKTLGVVPATFAESYTSDGSYNEEIIINVNLGGAGYNLDIHLPFSTLNKGLVPYDSNRYGYMCFRGQCCEFGLMTTNYTDVSKAIAELVRFINTNNSASNLTVDKLVYTVRARNVFVSKIELMTTFGNPPTV